MKRFLLTAACALLIAVSASGAQKDTLRILAIGNSFSVNAVEQNLHEIAAADGRVAIIGNMFIGGCSLERHWNNSKDGSTDYRYCKISADGQKVYTPGFTLEQALSDEQWDVVTFQQASPKSGLPETYEPYLTELLAFVAERVPSGARYGFHQTWAYAKDSKHSAFPTYGRDQDRMYQCIMDASSAACRSHGLKVIPCGTMVQDLRGTGIGDNLTRDGFHLNELGCYGAACTWYQALFGRSVRNNSYVPEGISPEDAALARKAAAKACRKPFAVSNVR